MQNFRPKLISKIRDFGQNSAIFDSDNPREVNNEFGDTKKCFWGLWNLFGAGRKFFDHPAPKSSILGCRNFCKIAFFGLISPLFDPGGPKESQTGFFQYQKLFTMSFESLWCVPRTFHPTWLKKVGFGGSEISTKPILTIFGRKMFFELFFWISKKSYLGC